MSEEANTDPEVELADGENKQARRLTDAQWAEIVEAYELGVKGITELAEEYGVSRQNLSGRFKINGIQKGSRAGELKQAVNQAAKAQAAQAAAQADRFAEKKAEYIEETRMQGYAALKQVQIIAAKIVIEAHRAGRAMATIDDDMKALRRYQAILTENVRTRLGDVLNANESVDPDDLPALIVEDLTAEEVAEHHREIGALDDDTDIDQLMQSIDQDLGEADI